MRGVCTSKKLEQLEQLELERLGVFVSYLKSSISMKYNIHKNPALVFHIDKKHIKLHISPLKSIK
jgi:hypothetical protein